MCNRSIFPPGPSGHGPGQALSRDKLIGYLWAETDEKKARLLLSESLYVIRKHLGEDAVLTTGDDLRLNSKVVWTDAVAFLESLEEGEEVLAAELYKGPFLDGFYIRDAQEFEQWVDGQRSRLERCFADTLRKLAMAAEGAHGSGPGTRPSRRILGCTCTANGPPIEALPEETGSNG